MCCKRRTSGWLGARIVSPNAWRSWGGVRRFGPAGMRTPWRAGVSAHARLRPSGPTAPGAVDQRDELERRVPAYQRGWRGSRRGSRGRASLTVRARPATCVPLRASMALCAARVSGISTKPKPRARPVSRSVIILTVSTVPYDSKSFGLRRHESS